MSHRRPELAYFSESLEHVPLAIAYWNQDEQGCWTHTVAQLAAVFNLRSGIHKLVKQTCSASNPAILCESCGSRAESFTRTEYDQRWAHVELGPKRPRPHGALLCHKCIKDFMDRMLARNRPQRETTELKPARVRPTARTAASFDITTTDAFLLYGLLQTVGERTPRNALAPWSHQKPLLFAHEDDTGMAYECLLNSEWLAYRDAANLFERDWKSKRWLIRPSHVDIEPTRLIDLLDSKLCEAAPQEWIPMWEWVCRSELRSMFEYCQWRAGFGRGSWTPQTEDYLMGALDHLTLPQLQALIWNTFKGLAFDANARRDISTMLPSSFARLISDSAANGHALPAWRRKPGALVARFTSLLWDRLGGEETASSLTRGKWAELLG
jgi:ribosomal protein L34E